MISALLGVVGLGRFASSPYAMAGVVASAIVALVLFGMTYLKVHDYIVEGRATALCEERERADRLAKQNEALLEANRIAQSTLQVRGDALRLGESRIKMLEVELEEARRAANQIEDSCRVVFPADDPWLRRKRPHAAGGR